MLTSKFLLPIAVFLTTLLAFAFSWGGTVNIPSYDGRTYIYIARSFEGLGFWDALEATRTSFTSTYTKLFGLPLAPFLNAFGYSEGNIAFAFSVFLAFAMAALFLLARRTFPSRNEVIVALVSTVIALSIGNNIRAVSTWYPDFSGVFCLIVLMIAISPSRKMGLKSLGVAIIAGFLAVYLRRHFIFGFTFIYFAYGLTFFFLLAQNKAITEELKRSLFELAKGKPPRGLLEFLEIRNLLWVVAAGFLTSVLLIAVEPRYLANTLAESATYGGYRQSFIGTISAFAERIGWFPLSLATLGLCVGAFSTDAGRSDRVFIAAFHTVFLILWPAFVGHRSIQHMLLLSAVTVPMGLMVLVLMAGNLAERFLERKKLSAAVSIVLTFALTAVIMLPGAGKTMGIDHRSRFGEREDVAAFGQALERIAVSDDLSPEANRNIVFLAAGGALNAAVAQSLIERLGDERLRVLPFGVIDQRDPFLLHSINAADYVVLTSPASIHLAPESHSMMIEAANLIHQGESIGSQFRLMTTLDAGLGRQIEIYSRRESWNTAHSFETVALIRQRGSENLRIPFWMDISPRYDARPPYVADNQNWFSSGPRQNVPGIPFTLITTEDASQMAQLSFRYRSGCPSVSVRVQVFHNGSFHSETEFGYSNSQGTSEFQQVDMALPPSSDGESVSLAILATPRDGVRCGILIRDLPLSGAD